MKKEEIILTEDEKQQLNELAEEYFEVCAEFKSIDAKKKALGSVIKATMETFGVSKYISDESISLSVSRRKNVSFDEDLLLSECKDFNIDNLIKTKEYVDMEVLESALYNESNSGFKEAVKKCEIVKPDTVELRCTKKQTLNE